MVQVCLCGLGPIETTLAEVRGSLRVLPTREGRVGAGSLANGPSRDHTPIFGMPRAPLHTSPLCPHRRKEEWMGWSLKLFCPSQALTGHKVAGIPQQKTACGNHIRAVLSPLLEHWGRHSSWERWEALPLQIPLCEARAKPKPLCWVSKWGSGGGAGASQISGIHAFNQTPRRHFLPQTKCEV